MAVLNQVRNKVILNANTANPTSITQNLNLISEDDALLKFSTDGSGANPIFSIKKDATTNKISLHLDSPSLLKDENGTSLGAMSPIELTKDCKVDVKPRKTEGVVTAGQEIEVKVKSTSGQEFVLTANATGVSYATNGQKFEYSADPNKSLSMGMSEKCIEMYMGKKVAGAGLFNHPIQYDGDFPLPILGLYAKNMKGTKVENLGKNFSLHSFDLNASKDKPYVFFHDHASNKKMIYANGRMQECNEFKLMRDGNALKIVAICKGSAYSLDLKSVDGELTADSQKALSEFLKFSESEPRIANTTESSRSKKNTMYVDGRQLNIEKKDSIGTTSVRYVAKGMDYKVDEEEVEIDPEDPIKDPEDPIKDPEDPIKDPEDPIKDPEEPIKDPEDPIKAPIKDPEPEPTPELKQEKKKEELKPQEEAVNIKGEKTAKYLGSVAGVLAFFFMCGALLTGAMPLLGIGLALLTTAVVSDTFAKKLNFTIYKQVIGKITQAEANEREDRVEEENFMMHEAELGTYDEKIAEHAAGADTVLESEHLKALTDAYNAYGVGFNITNDEAERIKQLTQPEGHQIRTSMRSGIHGIINAPTTTDKEKEEKQKIINNFIDDHFQPEMPAEERQAIRDMFMSDDPEIKSALADLDISLEKLEKEEVEKNNTLNNQKRTLGNMRDDMIARVINSKHLSPEKRVEFFKRYSSIIYRHYALDDNLSQDKLEKLLEKLPAQEQENCIKILLESGDKLDKQMTGIESIAKVDSEKFERADIAKFVVDQTNKLLNPYLDEYSMCTEDPLTDAAFDFFQATSYDVNSSNLDKISSTIGKTKYHKTPSTNDLSKDFNIVYQQAKKLGIITDIAKMYAIDPKLAQGPTPDNYKWDMDYDGPNKSSIYPTGGYNEDKHKAISADKRLFALIRDYAQTKSGEAEYATLIETIDSLTSNETIHKCQYEQMKEFFNDFVSKEFDDYKDEDLLKYEANIEKDYQNLLSKRSSIFSSSSQPYAFIEDESELKEAMLLEYYIKNQVSAAGNDTTKKSYQEALTYLNLIKDGTIAKEEMLKAETNALGYHQKTTVAHDIYDSARDLDDKVFKYKNYLNFIQSIPEPERDSLREEIRQVGADRKNILKLLYTKYGDVEIEDRVMSVSEMLLEYTDVKEVLGPHENYAAFNRWPETTQAKYLLEHMKQNQFNSAEALGYIKRMEDDILERANKEISCVAGDLGGEFSHKLYEMVVKGEKMDELTPFTIRNTIKSQEAEDEKEIKSMEETNKIFSSAWNKALSGDFADLEKLMMPPDVNNSTIEEMEQHGKNMELLTRFGIDTKDIEKTLKSIANAKTDEEKAVAIKKAKASFFMSERTANYSRLGVETIADRKRKFLHNFNVNRTETEHDRKFLDAQESTNQLKSDVDTFTTKYEAIYALKRKGKSETEVKNILYWFATGNVMFLKTIKELEGIHFSKKDAEMISRLGLTPDLVSEESIIDIFDMIEARQKQQQEEFDAVRAEGKDNRVDPNRSANLANSKSPKKIRNRISLISRLFRNADNKFKKQHELDAEQKELVGELTPEVVEEIEKEEGERDAS